jgi:hypothetical protein
MENKKVSPDVLAVEIKNISANLVKLEAGNQKSFDEIKQIIKEWKDDFSNQFKSVSTRVDTLYGYHEISKDDRRDLHRKDDEQAASIKTLEKDVTDIKTNVALINNSKIETNGFKKGLDNFAKVITTLATVIVSLGIIISFIGVLYILFTSLNKG